jgi:hypothetical protein
MSRWFGCLAQSNLVQAGAGLSRNGIAAETLQTSRSGCLAGKLSESSPKAAQNLLALRFAELVRC